MRKEKELSNAILFGAGASFGSNNTNVPPLGDDLFKALQKFNPPGWGSLSKDIEKEFLGDFEKGMTKLAEINSHSMPILQRAMAAFFFNYQPTMNNLYHVLAKRIKEHDWRGQLVTLNYERLLEVSLCHEGLQPVVDSTTLTKGQVELCLPHGCCHIFSKGVQASSHGVSISGVGVTFDGDIEVISDPQQFNQKINNDAVPPVMSYFEPKKNTSSGVSFIKQQRQRWSQIATNTENIAIIGIRVRENDSHIWDVLESTKSRIIYCGGEEAGSEFSAWAKKHGRSGDLVLAEFFSNEFDTICAEVGICA